MPEPATAPARSAPSHRRERFECPRCGRHFERNVRLGIFAMCPGCGGRAYGVAVLQDIAQAHVRQREKAKPKPAGKRPTVVGTFPDTTPPPARATPEPAAEPRRGFFARLLGDQDED